VYNDYMKLRNKFYGMHVKKGAVQTPAIKTVGEICPVALS